MKKGSPAFDAYIAKAPDFARPMDEGPLPDVAMVTDLASKVDLARSQLRRKSLQPFHILIASKDIDVLPDLALFAHTKGGICSPLKEGEQLTLEHPQTSKRVLVWTVTNGLLKQTSSDTSIRSKCRAVILYRAVAQAGLSAGATERVFLATY